MPPTNHAAWLKDAEAGKLSIEQAPHPTPNANEIVIKVAAAAINPADWLIMGQASWLVKSYPTILGCDVAGQVIQVGRNISGFHPGDRVLGLANASTTGEPKRGGFQQYAVLAPPLVAKVPPSVSDQQAAVLPLGVTTAASCLFVEQAMGLAVPPSRAGAGKVVLVWGGSSSVGACAVQLAVAAGYEVFTTASAHNLGFCLSLGASRVFDYNDGEVEERVVAALDGVEFAGAMSAVAGEEMHACLCRILARSAGTKVLGSILPGAEKLATHGVEIRPVFASTIAENEVGPQIFSVFLPRALQEGTFKCKPDPFVVGDGLESVEEGLELHKAGVSARKIVITL